METFQEINLFPKIAFELEFYLFDKRKSIYERPKVATSPKSKRRSEGTQVYGMKELDDYYKKQGLDESLKKLSKISTRYNR